jgi:hypothetical protein
MPSPDIYVFKRTHHLVKKRRTAGVLGVRGVGRECLWRTIRYSCGLASSCAGAAVEKVGYRSKPAWEDGYLGCKLVADRPVGLFSWWISVIG